MGVKLKGISTVDGRTIEVEISDLEQSRSRLIGSLFKYNYNSVPTPPPNSSQIRSNGATSEDSTIIWVNRIDNSNQDLKYVLMQLKTGDKLYVQDIDNADSYAVFKLTDDAIDDGNHVTFNVECEDFSGQALGGTAILLGIFA